MNIDHDEVSALTAIKTALDLTYAALASPTTNFPPAAADAETDNPIQTKSAPALSGGGGN